MFKDHPRGLPVLFFTEMWERFAYYLMIGIFVLYMTDSEKSGMGWGTTFANDIYGWFIALVYLTPFIGGILADRYFGYRKSIIFGGLLMAAGYLGLGLVPGAVPFYISLALVVLGNGFFKPNISAIVGRLYEEGSPLKDSGYSIFYMGINIGAFVCNFVAAVLRNQFGWGYAFAAAGIGMILGVIWFARGQEAFAEVSDRGDGSGVESGILMKLTLGIFLPSIVCGLAGYMFASMLNLGGFFAADNAANVAFIFAVIPILIYYFLIWAKAPREEKGPIAALLAIFGVVIIFWMVFHQNGNTLTLWARDHTHREAGAFTKVLDFLYMGEPAPDSYWDNIPAAERPAPGTQTSLLSTEILQSINPGFIILFTPLVVGFFSWLRARKKEPSTPAKIAWGLVITAASALVMVAAVRATAGGTEKGSLMWLFATYGVITIGELFLSPMGLSLVSKLAPTRLTALMMGGWFLSTSIGNKMAGIIGGLWEQVDSLETIFWINGLSAMGAAALIAIMVPWIKRVMIEHEHQVNQRNTKTKTA